MAHKFFSLFSKNSPEPQNPSSSVLQDRIAFLDEFPSVLLLLDASGAVRYANRRAAELLGCAQGAVEGLNISALGLTPEEVACLIAHTEQKLYKELVSKNLRTFAASVKASVFADTQWVLLALEEVPQYQDLRADRVYFQSLVEHYPFAVTVQDKAGLCLGWNAKAEELFAHSKDYATGKPLYENLPQELTGALERLDREAILDGHSLSDVTVTFKDKQDKEHRLCVTKVPITGPDGNARALLTVYEDITARSRKEEELLQSRNLLRAVVDHVPLGLYTRTVSGDMTFYNRQSQEVFNEKNPGKVNEPHEKQTREDAERYAQREQDILKEGKRKEFPDEIYTDEQGNQKIIHMIKVPLKDAGPEPLVLSIVEDVTVRREQESEIFRANSFLKSILDNAPIALYARTKEGKLMFSNKKCEDLFGVQSPDDFNSAGDMKHETAEQVNAYIAREHEILAAGHVQDIAEEEYVTSSGERRLVHLIKVPVRDMDGLPGFVITLAENLTEKRRQEAELSKSNSFRDVILENAPIAIYAYSPEGELLFINKYAQALFMDENYSSDEEDYYRQRENNIFNEGKMMEIPEEWFTSASGKRILFHLIKVPVFDDTGKPFMVLTIAEDITERKAQEQEIVSAKNFLQSVINNLPVALSVKDGRGRYILWNKKSEDLFGVTAQDVIGKTYYREDMTREQAEFLNEADMRVFAARKEQNIPQELISTATEGVKIMHTVKTPVFKEDGTPDCLLSVSEDITQKTKMEKQLREAGDKNTLLVENAREGILILEDYKVIYANRAVCNMLGYGAVEELTGLPVKELVSKDHHLFVKDKYDAVLNEAAESDRPIDVSFLKKNGSKVEAEFVAVASKYLGRRIVLAFVRDVTSVNKVIRELKNDRERFRTAFLQNTVPSFILTHKGYISVMNEACHKLFNFTEADRNFYRNVYMRPAMTLAVRKTLKRGEPAQMDYLFDFDAAKVTFPQRIKGEGKLPLRVGFVPINKRDTKEGVIADYIVSLEIRRPAAPPPPPAPVQKAAPKEAALLPKADACARCSDTFQIEECNGLFCSLCQLSREELKGALLKSLFAEVSRGALEEDLKTLGTDGAVENREYFLTLGGGLETVPVRVTAVREADGRYLFVFRNMAFHQQIMKILEERSAQLNALLEATDGVVFSVRFEQERLGKIQQANKFLSRLLGYTHDELVNLPFADLFKAAGTETDEETRRTLKAAGPELSAAGKASFRADVYRKDGSSFPAEVTAALLDAPDQNAALVVVRDLSAHFDILAKESKEAKELSSVRQALPGLYLKTDNNGRGLEVYSNLSYLDNDRAKARFLDKLPAEYWNEDAAARELFAVKEALSINITSQFEFSQEFEGVTRFFEASVTPISGRAEAVIWLKDATDRRTHEEHIHELYRISNAEGVTLTDLLDKMLDFGRRVFDCEVGFVARFTGTQRDKMTLLYVSKNDFNLQRQMLFPVEGCLSEVAAGNMTAEGRLDEFSCARCVHKEKGFNALLAAPLSVGGTAAGALCFASRCAREEFPSGAEELLGIMARVLALRIELREAEKTIGETSRRLIRTLEYVDVPSVIINTDYYITYANDSFMEHTGRRQETVKGRGLFEEFIRHESIARQMFEGAEKAGSGKAFQVKLDLLGGDGRYTETAWDVFILQDTAGQAEGYALIASGR